MCNRRMYTTRVLAWARCPLLYVLLDLVTVKLPTPSFGPYHDISPFLTVLIAAGGQITLITFVALVVVTIAAPVPGAPVVAPVVVLMIQVERVVALVMVLVVPVASGYLCGS